MTHRAVVAVGSNIAPQDHVSQAQKRIEQAHRILAVSVFVWTPAIGRPGQPDFLNGALLVETVMAQNEFRAWLRALEDSLGRVRGPDKYGPRTIDLDLVVWNGEITDPDVYHRQFLRDAVLQVAPELAAMLRAGS